MCMRIFSKKEARLLRAENYWVQKSYIHLVVLSTGKQFQTSARWQHRSTLGFSKYSLLPFFINRNVPHSFIFYSPNNWIKKVQNTTNNRIIWKIRKLIVADQNRLYILSHRAMLYFGWKDISFWVKHWTNLEHVIENK